eukprot:12903209-Prorocentrum_lima.AAC.1
MEALCLPSLGLHAARCEGRTGRLQAICEGFDGDGPGEVQTPHPWIAPEARVREPIHPRHRKHRDAEGRHI